MYLPHEDVKDVNYFRGVLDNLFKNGGKDGSTVRFGLTGKGIHPNYLLVRKDGASFPFLGVNHSLDHTATGHYDEDNITPDSYSIAEIQEYIKSTILL